MPLTKKLINWSSSFTISYLQLLIQSKAFLGNLCRDTMPKLPFCPDSFFCLLESNSNINLAVFNFNKGLQLNKQCYTSWPSNKPLINFIKSVRGVIACCINFATCYLGDPIQDILTGIVDSNQKRKIGTLAPNMMSKFCQRDTSLSIKEARYVC